MGFINRGRLNIRKRNSCASARVSLSDVQPPSVYKSHILNGPIKKLYITHSAWTDISYWSSLLDLKLALKTQDFLNVELTLKYGIRSILYICILKTDISIYPFISENIIWTYFLFLLQFQPRYLKLLITPSKFSGTRKITLISVVWDEVQLCDIES